MSAVVRRPVAFVAALALFVEAVGVVLVNGVLATVVENQDMSVGGLESGAMSGGAWAMGGVSGLGLLLCGLVLLLTGVRDRAPGRWGRIALVVCAVAHGVLGALAVGLVGWIAFACLMVVLGLIVLTLVAYGPEPVRPVAAGAFAADGAVDGGASADGSGPGDRAAV
ncbi:hypothetical protein [Streptomyces sp. NPDC052042]|uniref:hypothetical protein n=1 Tax=Streptomyces sp. NPDC052042 TaxID=3365683 RepID=UPI0037D0699C